MQTDCFVRQHTMVVIFYVAVVRYFQTAAVQRLRQHQQLCKTASTYITTTTTTISTHCPYTCNKITCTRIYILVLHIAYNIMEKQEMNE